MQDYFANERSTAWNNIDDMNEENDEIKQTLPELEETLEAL